jgi:predicted nucleotidyltransferase
MHPAVSAHLQDIVAICRQHRIRRLDVFGSAARQADFKVDSSDVDLLVEFEPDAQRGLETYFNAKTALEDVLHRKVDLMEFGAVRNPYLLREIEIGRETLYAS